MSSSCVVIDTRAVPTARVFGHTSSTACQKPSAPSATASSGADRKPTPLEVEEQFPPGLRALAHALDEADELLFALRRGADDDQQALRVVLQASLHVNAVGPEDGVIGRPSLWIAEDFWVLRFRPMVKRGPWLRPQASEGEAQHGPFCWTGRIGQGDQHLHCG